jgi:signal transduction histidine kinase
MVQVAVVDTGPGIPPEERERIFEKFTQMPGQAGSVRGSGLGLAFCRMAVEAHGGRIWIEDGPEGKGSRFAFTLPKARV